MSERNPDPSFEALVGWLFDRGFKVAFYCGPNGYAARIWRAEQPTSDKPLIHAATDPEDGPPRETIREAIRLLVAWKKAKDKTAEEGTEDE